MSQQTTRIEQALAAEAVRIADAGECTLTSGAPASSLTLTLPSAIGTAGQGLAVNPDGTMEFVDIVPQTQPIKFSAHRGADYSVTAGANVVPMDGGIYPSSTPYATIVSGGADAGKIQFTTAATGLTFMVIGKTYGSHSGMVAGIGLENGGTLKGVEVDTVNNRIWGLHNQRKPLYPNRAQRSVVIGSVTVSGASLVSLLVYVDATQTMSPISDPNNPFSASLRSLAEIEFYCIA
jgi:hypothetical protein